MKNKTISEDNLVNIGPPSVLPPEDRTGESDALPAIRKKYNLSDTRNDTLRAKMIYALPPEVLCLFRLYGLSYDAIAKQVDSPKAAIYNLARYYQMKCSPKYAGFAPIPLKPLKDMLNSDESIADLAEKCRNRYSQNLLYILHIRDEKRVVHQRQATVSPEGLKNYICDYGLTARDFDLEKIISFRENKWSWTKINEYYFVSAYTLKSFVHSAVFPAGLVAVYRLSGYSGKDMLLTVPDKYRKLLGLTSTAVTRLIGQYSDPRNDSYDKFEIISGKFLSLMQNRGMSAEEIIQSLPDTTVSASAPHLGMDAPEKIVSSEITPDGLLLYMKDLKHHNHSTENL